MRGSLASVAFAPTSASGPSSRPCCSRRTAASRTGRGAARRRCPGRQRSSRRHVDARGTPVRQSSASVTSGARSSRGGRRTGSPRSARRPGPPTQAIDRALAGGRVKRAFGARQGARFESGVHVAGASRWRWAGPGHAFPPDVAVVGQRDVGEDAVRVERAIALALVSAGARRDAEEAGLRVDRVEAAVVAEAHPADVVADRLDLPARDRRLEHREVGLAARDGNAAAT